MNNNKVPLGKAEDLSGRIFNFLQPLYRTHNINNRVAWRCKCLRCNTEVDVRADHLKGGYIKSCGCYASFIGSEHFKKIHPSSEVSQKNITGLKSGYLIALEPTEKRYHANVIWKCQCINPMHITPVYCEVPATHIIQQKKKSCGCIKSFGEAKIAELLTQANIPFERQKTFSSCKRYDNHPLRFDFYVNNSYLIEYDGSQHFYAGGGWNTEEQLLLTQQNDKIKNQWCKDNNIKLIRIPYTHLEQLSINDLCIETSLFVI